jgi:hypothetical protein
MQSWLEWPIKIFLAPLICVLFCLRLRPRLEGMENLSVVVIHDRWFCCLLLVYFVLLLFVMSDHRHIWPCRKLCQIKGTAVCFELLIWTASQRWWGLLHVSCQLPWCPSCNLVVNQDLSKSSSTHIYVLMLVLKDVLFFLLLTLCPLTWPWCSLASQIWSSCSSSPSSE